MQAFRHLLTDERFLEHGWARTPFKLDEKWDFAVRGSGAEGEAASLALAQTCPSRTFPASCSPNESS